MNKEGILISIEPVFIDRSVVLSAYIHRYSQYVLIAIMVMVLFCYHPSLFYVLISVVIIIISCLLFLMLIETGGKQHTLAFFENKLILTKDGVVVREFDKIKKVKFVISSYKGRSALFTFWKERGYNQIIIVQEDGRRFNCVFQFGSRAEFENFMERYEAIKLTNLVSYNIKVNKIFT